MRASEQIVSELRMGELNPTSDIVQWNLRHELGEDGVTA